MSKSIHPTLSGTPRPTEILRRYHDATYEGTPATKNAITGVTFEEYWALLRAKYPGISAYRAAVEAPRDDLRRLAERFEPDPPDPPLSCRAEEIRLAAAVDLRKATIAPETERLLLDRIKKVSGWDGLRRIQALDDLSVNVCGSDERAVLEPPLTLRRAGVNSCDDTCVFTVLRSVRVRELYVNHGDQTVADLEPLRAHRTLSKLWLQAGLIRGLGALDALPIQTLSLEYVEPDDELRALLRAVAGTIEELDLTSRRPFGPDLLPPLPRLRRLLLPGYAETRAAWIDFAVDHPEIACVFGRLPEPATRAVVVSVEEIYRGVDILRHTKGKTVKFEVAADLTSEIPGYDGDNGDLEDILRPLARKVKKKISWSSEADTLVARSNDVATCRWVIDTAIALGRAI